MDMAVAVTTTTSSSNGSSPAYVAKPPPPPPSVAAFHKTTAAAAGYNSYNGHAATTAPVSPSSDERRALDGVVLALHAAAALLAFVGASLVASCRHGDWMEFGRYHEYRYLLGASAAACLYSAAQALRGYFRRRRRRPSPSGGGGGGGGGLLGFAGDQLVAYMLVTAASAALPITIRMRSAVVNVFTDAMVAAIGMAFAAFAALALSAIISGFSISSSSY
jgi:hypothetical protein